MRHLSLTLLLCLSAVTAMAQGVYKWVDADGKTHYGSQPPATDKGGEALKLHSNSGFGGNNNGKAVEYNADGTKKISKDVQDFAKGMEKALKKQDSKEVPLDCMSAIKNANDQSDTMLEVGAKNVKDGYLSQADYDAQAAKVRQAKAETTLAHCQFSTGKERAFYQCMSNGKNHILACTK
jgi:hypothetical protein